MFVGVVVLNLFVLLTIFWASCVTASDGPIVAIRNGKIQGTESNTIGNNSTYYAFKGIPFAQPPLQNLRFTDPVKPSNWSDVLNCTQDKSECVQGSGPVTGTEDCLYINVYTPNVNATNLTVMVWIYGGGFIAGNSSYTYYGPDYFLEEGVVFVSFNYRLGIFGFLSTGDTTCSGNWGLKDQVLALEWVRDNIKFFGGNPNNVTIFGESAGGASVSYLMQTNRTKGLYNAAIMQSGTSLNLWALDTRAQELAFSTGLSLGIVALTSNTLLTNLRKVNANSLQKAAYDNLLVVTASNAFQGIPFSPVVEPANAPGALFTSSSDNLLRAGRFIKVPVLMGSNTNEAGGWASFPLIFRAYLLYYDVVTDNLAPYSISALTLVRTLAAYKIRLDYFGFSAFTAQYSNVIRFINDDQFFRPIRRAALDMANYTDVYFYKFGYEGIISGVTARNYSGVGHAEDLQYLFRSYNDYDDEDLVVGRKMVKLWSNFAKFSNPTPVEDSSLDNAKWLPLNKSSPNFNYLVINSTLSMAENPNQAGWTYYQEIFKVYGDESYTTY